MRTGSSKSQLRPSDIRGLESREGGICPSSDGRIVSPLKNSITCGYVLTHSFNKRRDDFKSDREHDDYLEEVEDLSKRSLSIDVQH
jgi:hypothetical protein